MFAKMLRFKIKNVSFYPFNFYFLLNVFIQIFSD